jgi:hypothetical protein
VSSNSGRDASGHEVLARRGWYLHVSPLIPVIIAATYSCHFPNRSWEIVTTLDFEWNVIRHQRRQWTIWVRDDKALLSVFLI